MMKAAEYNLGSLVANKDLPVISGWLVMQGRTSGGVVFHFPCSIGLEAING